MPPYGIPSPKKPVRRHLPHIFSLGLLLPQHIPKARLRFATPTGAGAQARAAIWFPFPGDFNMRSTASMLSIGRVSTPIRTLRLLYGNGLGGTLHFEVIDRT